MTAFLATGLFIDGFAGGGGASTGIAQAIGRDVDIAVNHSPSAIAIHKANHPATEHHCQDIRIVWPTAATRMRPVAGAWFSPDCKEHSKAKGGPVKDRNIRQLPWEILVWLQYDSSNALHYVDPPYHPDTRASGNRRRVGPGSEPWQVYKHELDRAQHSELLDVLCSLEGMVAVSGYPHPSYDEMLGDWRCVTRAAYADGARPRTECLWLNPALVRSLGAGPLFCQSAAPAALTE